MVNNDTYISIYNKYICRGLFVRNYFGSEHGKGKSDGETGRFVQEMSRAVAGGNNFRNASDLVSFGQSTFKSTEYRK